MADQVIEVPGLRKVEIPKTFDVPKSKTPSTASKGRWAWFGSIWNPIVMSVDCGIAFPCWTNMGSPTRGGTQMMSPTAGQMGGIPVDVDALPGSIARVTTELYERMVHQLDRCYYRVWGIKPMERQEIDLGVYEEIMLARRLLAAKKDGDATFANVTLQAKSQKEATLIMQMKLMEPHELHRVACLQTPEIAETGERPDIPAGCLVWFQWLDELEGQDEDRAKRYRPAGFSILPCKPPLLREPNKDQAAWYGKLCDRTEKAFKRGIPVDRLSENGVSTFEEYFSETQEGKSELLMPYVRL